MKRPAALLALLAVTLNALGPLIAQAQPRDSLIVAVVCVSGAGTHAIDLTRKQPGGGSHSPDHCKLCVSGGERSSVYLPTQSIAMQGVADQVLEASCSSAAPFQSAASLSAPPRGPPSIL